MPCRGGAGERELKGNEMNESSIRYDLLKLLGGIGAKEKHLNVSDFESYVSSYWGVDGIRTLRKLQAEGFVKKGTRAQLTSLGSDEIKKREESESEDVECELAEAEKNAFKTCLIDWTQDFSSAKSVSSNTKIWRYIGINTFYKMLESGTNAFSHISKWEDPFEGFIFKCSQIMLDGAPVDLHYVYKNYYGQCWTLDGRESDFRWRAYGNRGRMLRIQTTVGKLFDSLKSITPANRLHTACRMGCVVYKDSTSFKKEIDEIGNKDVINSNGLTPDRLLFIKRNEFKEEDEFRVVLNVVPFLHERALKDGNNVNDLDLHDGQAAYKTSVLDLIDEILIDPCMNQNMVDHLMCRVAIADKKMKGLIPRQSDLFKWPNSAK